MATFYGRLRPADFDTSINPGDLDRVPVAGETENMRAHVLQHVPFEGPGSIEAWLNDAGWETTGTRFFHSESLPDFQKLNFLIVLGGPMSVKDEATVPWLAGEKRFIRDAIAGGVPVLGICLGAQLIASALGADVRKNTQKEIGWFPVQGIPPADRSCYQFPASMDVFHWHGETFDLPAAAVHLARSEACENQAFQLGRSVIGLQFHLETTPGSAKELVEHCRSELVPARFVQNEKTLLEQSIEKSRQANALMAEVVSYLTGG